MRDKSLEVKDINYSTVNLTMFMFHYGDIIRNQWAAFVGIVVSCVWLILCWGAAVNGYAVDVVDVVNIVSLVLELFMLLLWILLVEMLLDGCVDVLLALILMSLLMFLLIMLTLVVEWVVF